MNELVSILSAPPPLLVWGVFTRLVGLLFLISFASLSSQVVAIAGEHGAMPIRRVLAKYTEDFPGWRRFLYVPTLLWLSPSDRMLRGLPALGLVAASVVIYGGPLSPYALALCYVVYVSLDRAIGLVFPWDCLLFEIGFFGIFLPATEALPNVSASALPAPALAIAFRLLAARVLLGFGKFKFIGATKEDRGYLTGFLINQPLASPVGYYLHKAPLWVLKGAMVLMFVQEIIMPPLLLVPGALGIAAGASIAALMLGIWVAGNFGYFNLAIIVLCFTTLDSTALRAFSLSEAFSWEGPWLISSVVLLHTLGALWVFPYNSFCAQSWMHWTMFLRARPRFLAWPTTLLRIMHPLRWVHPYGVFPPKTMPGVRCIPLIEVSWDGQSWHECPHQYSPTSESSKPRFVAPHHPRGDQVAVYEGFGMSDSGVMHCLVGSGNPYGFTKHSGARLLVQRVLEGHAPSYGTVFFDEGVIPSDKPAPVAARVTTHMLTPTDWDDHKRTGKYWKREYIGPHLPETRLDPAFWDTLLPEPELFHPEDVIWRRRSKLRELDRRVRAGEDPHSAVLAASKDLSADDVERFWNELLPMLVAADKSSWSSMPQLVAAMRARFDDKTLRRLERIMGRYTFMLFEQLEPMFSDAGILPMFGKGTPPIAVKSHFHLWLLSQLALCEGREAYSRMIQAPLEVSALVPSFTLSSGMYLFGVFRFEVLWFEAKKLRLLTAFMEPKRPSGVQFSLANRELTEKLDAIAQRVFGSVEIVPFVRELFRDARFDEGQPERYPVFQIDPEGSGVVQRVFEADAKVALDLAAALQE